MAIAGLTLIMGSMVGMGSIQLMSLGPAQRALAYGSNLQSPNIELTMPELMELRRRGWDNYPEFVEDAKRQGVNEIVAGKMYALTEHLLSYDEAMRLEGHGEQGLALNLQARLLRLGYEPHEAAALARASWNHPDVGSALVLYRRGQITQAQALAHVSANGYDRQYFDQMVRAAELTMTLEQMITLWRRGTITKAQCVAYMKAAGVQPEQIELVLTATEAYPSVGDMVRFAVREVYSPDIVAKFGQMEDLPEKFIQEAAKGGLSREQAMNYWAAHWDLPSVTQGDEMLHRGVITEADHALLLRTLDVMPFWREKMKLISYSPYTRVDTRRMFEMGILDRAGVKRAYLDQGYDEAHAENLTEFTVRDALPAGKDLTQANIISAYRESELDRAAALSMIQALGYDAHEAEVLLTLDDIKVHDAERTQVIDTLKAMYKAGVMDAVEFQTELDKLNLKAAYANKILATTILEKKSLGALPSKADVLNWYKRGVIKEADYLRRMDLLGYSADDAKLYIQSSAPEV